MLTALIDSVVEDRGIITNAIANAGKLPQQGQENVSLLQQHKSASKTTPASTQFTFSCDSQMPGTVEWPGELAYRTRTTSADTSKGRPSRLGVREHGSESSEIVDTNGLKHKEAAPKPAGVRPAQSRMKARRRLDKELEEAARRRRQAAADSFFNNPPRKQDVWICEFCEYELIFGEPPRVLIRDYEMKDRRKRLEEAERRRLLEKAKAKSRKSRKNGKVTSKTNPGGANSSDQAPADGLDNDEAISMHQDHSHSTQFEEAYGDELEDHHLTSTSERLPTPGNGGHVEHPRAKT